MDTGVIDKKEVVPATTCEQTSVDGMPVDRRIARSKRALRSALIDLIEERGIDGFTVNDLCLRADLNRGTFYNHYHDKEDLIVEFEDEIMDDLLRLSSEMNKLTLVDLAKIRVASEPLPLFVNLFRYLYEQSDFLHAVLGSGGDLKFTRRLCDTLCTDFILRLLHERYRKNPTPFVNYYVAFYASAYMGVITRWLDSGMKETPEEMARIAIRLLFIKPGESIKL